VIRPTVSIGVSTARTDELDDHAVTRADHALYLAKDEGRNRTCTWAMVELRRLVDEAPCGQQSLDVLIRALERRVEPWLGPTQKQLLAETVGVSRVAGELAAILAPHERARIELAARIRGLSRVLVPEETLAKATRLSESEAALLACADAHAAEASVRLGADAWIASAIRDAHAHADGSGSTCELGALGPCPAAKIISVASAVVALHQPRPWRPALSWIDTLAELENESGRRFDPQVVAAARTWLDSQDSGDRGAREPEILPPPPS
jgi:response regulator RpfG family c-di-GMP phosphodiesterase